jgi:hypothetical protein
MWSVPYNVRMAEPRAANPPPSPSPPTLQQVEALQSAAFEAIRLGQFEAARGLAEGVLVLGFCAPALLLAHAWSCAHLGDVEAAARSLDGATTGSEALSGDQRAAFDAALNSVRAAMVAGKQSAAHQQLSTASKDLYGN